ncbi:hypothetical protein ABPG75_012201, partial [Micractinium tetrahymenae]
MAPKRQREEEAEPAQEAVKAPKKHLYRMRAHSNPLNDASFPVPLGPDAFDWAAHYPELHAAAAERGEALPQVEFADVGCGFGGLTVRLAEAYPDKLVMGMELRDKVTEYVKERILALRKQHRGRYRNASVVRTNAMKFLTNYFRKGQLTKLFFLFADPHFKASNHRRRIIQRTLLAEYAYLLRPGGLLYTITDVEDLGNWQRDRLEAHPLFERVSEEELANDPAAQLLLQGTEEGQKVARNGGKTWRHVSRPAVKTAFAVCPSRRLLALAEPGERATVTIYDLQTLKRRKILSAPAGEGTKEFVSLAFSGDGRYLAAQGGAPGWSLSLWVWEKSKLVASVRTAAAVGHTAVQCLFQPGEDPQYISVVGEGTCCLLAIEAGNTLRVLPSTLPPWLLDNDAKDLLAVGTRRGEVLIVGEGEVKQALQLGAAAGGIEALAAHSKGFVAGTSQGQLSTFERDSDNKPYRLGKTFAVDGGADSTAATGSAAATGRVSASGAAAPLGDAVASTRVGTPGAATPSSTAGGGAAPGSGNAAACGVRACSLAVSPADDSVAVLTSDGQLLQLAAASGDRRGLFSGVQPLAPSFHSGAIVGLASCARRAVVATAGADRTIRIWNYQDKSAELTKSFDEEISSLALHPTGYLLLAGFADKLRLMTVLSDDLRLIKELPIKAAREACFSNGGQYFAVVNGNTVHVFCTYTGASLAVLRGHNGKVRGLWWSSDDTALVTAGVDGAVYEWRVLEGRRAGMHAVGANPSNTSAVAGGPNAIFAGAQDKKLRSLEEAVGGGLAVAAEVDAGAGITQVLAPSPGGRLLFAATEDGSLRSYKLPLTPECQAVRCSLAPVTRLAASRDESVLFAATADGALFVYDVKDRDAA